MSYLKRRIAVFLCMLLAFSTVIVTVPQEQVQAATDVRLSWNFGAIIGNQTPTVLVKKGAKDLYIGDYIGVFEFGENYNYIPCISNASGVKYNSSNASVVKVDSKTGKMTAKKTGSATVSVRYKGKTEKCTINVVNSVASYKPSYGYASDKYASAFVKAFGSKITNRNRYELLGIYNKCYKYFSATGIFVKSSAEDTYVIYNPTLGRARALSKKLEAYAAERNPFATTSAKLIKVTSLSGSKKTVTAKINKKVDAEQIFGAQYAYSWDSKTSAKNSVEFPIYIRDTRDGHRYYAVATLKKGSNKVTIETRNLTLKKGVKYELEQHSSTGYGWIEGSKVSTFKAK